MNQKEFNDIRDKLTEAARSCAGAANFRAGLPRLANLPAFERLAREAGVTDAELKGFIALMKTEEIRSANRTCSWRKP